MLQTKTKKIKPIFQLSLFMPLSVLLLTISNPANGQAPTKSDFEIKIDNYLKLYLPNFTMTTDKIPETGKQFSITQLKTPTLIKEVTLKSKLTIQDKNGQTTNLKLYLSFYSFADSKQCKTAKDSLLNCFGGTCAKIEWDVSGQSAKTTPSIFIFNEKEIVSARITCEQENNYWHSFSEDIAKTFSENTSGILEAGCDGSIAFRKNQ